MWHIAGIPMFVSPWSPDFNQEQPPLSSAVMPVEFRGVPYLLFNRESLGRLATAVGKPVSLSLETERKENFEVARIYIRVNLMRDLPRTIITGFSNGKEHEISVTYPWLPLKCRHCQKFGHDGNTCQQQAKEGRQWVRKRSRSSSRPPHRRRPSESGDARQTTNTAIEKTKGGSEITEEELEDPENAKEVTTEKDLASRAGELNAGSEGIRELGKGAEIDGVENEAAEYEVTEDIKEEGELDENVGVENVLIEDEVAEVIREASAVAENGVGQNEVIEYETGQKAEDGQHGKMNKIIDAPQHAENEKKHKADLMGFAKGVAMEKRNKDGIDTFSETGKIQTKKAKRGDKGKAAGLTKPASLSYGESVKENILQQNIAKGVASGSSTVDLQTKMKDHSKGQGMVSSQDGEEQPFFLVTRRKSGRKANHQ